MRRMMFTGLLLTLSGTPLVASAELRTFAINLSDGSAGTFVADAQTVPSSAVVSFQLTRNGVTYSYLDGSLLFYPGDQALSGPVSTGAAAAGAQVQFLEFAGTNRNVSAGSCTYSPGWPDFGGSVCGAGPAGVTYAVELLPQPPAILTGFFPPVDPPSLATNMARSGRVVPLRFHAETPDGTAITDLTAADVKVESASIACNQITDETDVVETYVAAVNGSLINQGNGNYQFNFQTPKGIACAMVTLTLDDYVAPALMAMFEFRAK